MTAALNLGLLGNNVNTSGQVSLTAGVSGTLPVANGGTGAASLAANNVLLGNGTSVLQAVAPSTSGNVLTSNGSTWTSAAPPSPAPTTAQVLSATAGASAGAVGTYAFARLGTNLAFNATVAGSSLTPTSAAYSVYKGSSAGDTATLAVGTALSGTWRAMGTQTAVDSSPNFSDPIIYGATLFLRIS